VFFATLFALLVASRLCHLRILWEGDTLPLAAAQQMLHGKTIYRDIWYDKPPLVAAFHLLPAGYCRAPALHSQPSGRCA
jgi:hypothetical protein